MRMLIKAEEGNSHFLFLIGNVCLFFSDFKMFCRKSKSKKSFNVLNLKIKIIFEMEIQTLP